MKKHGTVCFIVKNNQVLMAEILYPDDKLIWTGIGGVVDPGETPEQAVVREFSEETKLSIKQEDLVKEKELDSDKYYMHIYIAKKYSGDEEILDPTIKQLKWMDFGELPYDKMHAGNDEWLPGILEKYRV